MDSYKEQVINRTRIINEKITQIEKKLSVLAGKKNLSEVELKEERNLLIEKSNLEIERNSLYREFERRENAKEQKTDEANNKDTSKSKSPWLTVGVWTLVLALAANMAVSCNNKKDKSVLSYENTPSVSATPTPGITATPTLSATPDVVTPVGMRPFTDPNNDEQVEQRAQDVYAQDFVELLSGMDDKANKYAADTEIEQVINISNGVLGDDTEYAPTMVDQYVQRRTDIMGNYGSSPQVDKMYPMHYSNLAVDGTEEQEFAAEYDGFYNAIVDSRNANDDEATVKNIQNLATAMYDDFTMRGAYGGINPWNLDPEVRLYALGSAVERWGSHVKEWLLSHKATICVEVCRNRETGEMMQVNVEAIYDAIVTGKKNEVTLYVYGEEVYQLISEEFYKDLCKTLEYENTLRLKK